MITENLIKLNQKLNNKYEAIQLAGELLFENGYVNKEYIESMHKRDQKLSVFMGNMIAIPHGTEEGRKEVLKTGLSIIQVPDGVEFDGNKVKMIFGIAAKEDEHLEIISSIANICSDESNVKEMAKIKSSSELLKIIKRGELK